MEGEVIFFIKCFDEAMKFVLCKRKTDLYDIDIVGSEGASIRLPYTIFI